MLEESLYTPEEIAQKLKLSKYTIYELIKRGDLEAHRIGRSLRISDSQLAQYLNQNQHQENTFSAIIVSDANGKFAKILNAAQDLRFQVCTELNGQVKVTIRPEDIILSHTKLICSARNVHSGVVTELQETAQSMYMTLDIGVPLQVAITKQSVQEMNLKLGDSLYAIFKTMAVRVNS